MATYFKHRQFSRLAFLSFGLLIIAMLSSCAANEPLTQLNDTDTLVETSNFFLKPEGLLRIDEYNIICLKRVEFANISAHTNNLIEIDEADSILIREQDTLLENVKGFVFPKSGEQETLKNGTVCQKFFNDYENLGYEATTEIDYKSYHQKFLEQFT